jgi:Protein of unknown function (DUF1194)
MRSLQIALFIFFLTPVMLISAWSKAADVDLQLVLALDVSSSVNYDEFNLQMLGYVAAFRDPALHQAIAAGPTQKIAIAVTQWAGPLQQKVSVNWTLLSDAASSKAFANKLEYMSRGFPFGGTAIGNALSHSAGLFADSPYQSLRRVIDISGDGRQSHGQKLPGVLQQITASGITVNGLPILNEDAELDFYYMENVIGGAGSFVEIAEDYSVFARAIKRKLAREIRGVWLGS